MTASDRSGHCQGARQRPAEPDRVPHGDRLRRASRAPPPSMARRWVLPRWRRPGNGSAGTMAPSRSRPICWKPGAPSAGAARANGRPGKAASAKPTRRSGRNSNDGWAAICHRRWRQPCAPLSTSSSPSRRRLHAQRLAECPRCDQCHSPRDGRRVGRPHRLQQHPVEGDEAAHLGRLWRAVHPLGHPRACNGSRHERHGVAWRGDSLWQLPYLHRLLPAVDPAGSADGNKGDLRDDPRLDRPGRGRADASAHRTSRGPARHSQSPGFCDPAMRWKRPRSGRWR